MIDEHDFDSNQHGAWADGQRVPVEHGDNHSGEELLRRCCADLGVNYALALQIVSWADEHMPPRALDQSDGVSSATADKLRKLIQLYDKAFDILNSYQSNQKTPNDLRMSSCAMQLALGHTLAAGADNAAALARRFNLKKQTVNKCLNLFIAEKLNLPPLPGQRDETARQNMTKARKEQLTA